MEGTPAYKLKVTLKNGNVAYVYLDAEQFLELKSKETTTVRGPEIESETAMSDYKEVDGMIIPHTLTIKAGPMANSDDDDREDRAQPGSLRRPLHDARSRKRKRSPPQQ